MKLSELLARRQALLRQTRLANLAYAYRRLNEFAARIARAQLGGAVLLQPADPSVERYWPSLTALERSPAVLEEHFADDDVAELAEVLGYVTGNLAAEHAFRLEELAPQFLEPLRAELGRAGVDVSDEAESGATPDPSDLPGRSRPDAGG